MLLTRHTDQTPDGQSVVLWVRTPQGPQRLELPQQVSVCFLTRQDMPAARKCLEGCGQTWWIKPLSLKNFQHQPMAGLYCHRQADLVDCVKLLKRFGIVVWEDDVQVADRFLMERGIRSGVQWDHSNGQIRVRACESRPDVTLASLALTVQLSSDHQLLHIQQVALAMAGDVWEGSLTGDELQTGRQVYQSESDLIQGLLEQIAEWDPDILIGWQLIQEDLRHLQDRCDALGLTLTLGRSQDAVRWHQSAFQPGRWQASLEGRVLLDGPETLKTAFYFFQDDSLEAVVMAGNPTPSLVKSFGMDQDIPGVVGQARAMLWVFDSLQLLPYLAARSALTGLPLDRIGGSVAAFNNRYLPKLHRAGFVAPSVGTQRLHFSSPGGHVFDSQPGIYQQVLVLDFKSLYPSIIRTFKIDPLGLVLGLSGATEQPLAGFDGAVFDRTTNILPQLIASLWVQREQAKALGDAPLSQAIKILMNSFYGVLGSDGCRFYDPRLASSITKRGHEILVATRQWIQEQGYQVIYGDTDSVFVHVGSARTAEAEAIGQQLARGLNTWWRDHLAQRFQIESCLEIEFETRFDIFFMPRLRHHDKGSKKRYAGVQLTQQEERWVFKGLEAVRTDWSPLAQRFQRELYARVLKEQPYQDWIRQFVAALRRGEMDSLLVFDRPVKRRLDGYKAGLPPAAQALQQLQQAYPGRRFRRVRYVMTVKGVEAQGLQQSALDYDFYESRQLAPIADAILSFKGDQFDALITSQMGLI